MNTSANFPKGMQLKTKKKTKKIKKAQGKNYIRG
jgi:hypothetical protein